MGHTSSVAGGRASLRGAFAGLVLAAALAFVPAAGAEPISQLGQGRYPSAVTDATGTLHVVWNTFTQATPAPTLYCRLPAGAPSCQPVALPLPPGGTDTIAERPHILLRPSDGALFVVVTAVNAAVSTTYVYASGDGGTTWSGPTPIGTGVGDVVRARLAADGTAVDLLSPEGAAIRWQRAPLAGPPETRTIDLRAGTSFGAGFDTAFEETTLPDGRAALLGQDTHGRVGIRVLGAGDPYQQPTWSGWSVLPASGGSLWGADAGPSGAWLLGYHPTRLRVRRWNGRDFTTPRTMGTLAGVGGGDVGQSIGSGASDLQVDLAGRVHAAWLPGSEACGAVCFAYRRSEPYGFGPTFYYPVAPRGSSDPSTLVIAANAGGSGWIVYDDRALGAGGGHLFAVPLVTPPRYSRTGSRVLGHRRRTTLPARRGCIRPGSKFVHHLDLSGRRGDVRIVGVRFFFDDNQLVRIDRHAPYRVTYRLTFPALSRHVAAARVTYRSRGRLRHATIGRMIVMCP
jgi:hypothetical protein